MAVVHFESLETFLKEMKKINGSIKVYTVIRPISRIDVYVLCLSGLILHLRHKCGSEEELDKMVKSTFTEFHEVPKVEIP